MGSIVPDMELHDVRSQTWVCKLAVISWGKPDKVYCKLCGNQRGTVDLSKCRAQDSTVNVRVMSYAASGFYDAPKEIMKIAFSNSSSPFLASVSI